MADTQFLQIVGEAMENPRVRARVELIYRDVDAELASIRPICQLSGRCCRFEAYGHRLFVTTMEVASFAHEVSLASALAPYASAEDGRACRFQDGRMCIAHTIRPMGCRLFFCDSTKEQLLQDLYERMHRRLKDAHEELLVPYRYLEWRQALQAVGDLLPPGATRRA